jgi:hypothetical protein
MEVENKLKAMGLELPAAGAPPPGLAMPLLGTSVPRGLGCSASRLMPRTPRPDADGVCVCPICGDEGDLTRDMRAR